MNKAELVNEVHRLQGEGTSRAAAERAAASVLASTRSATASASYRALRCNVAFGAEVDCIRTNPWSSCGASSLFELRYRNTMLPRTAMTSTAVTGV